MEVTRYHKFLRVSAVLFTAILVFDSGYLTPVSKQLSDNTIYYLANLGTGVNAVVPPNEINTLTAQIAEQKKDLDAREALLDEREIDARTYTEADEVDYSTYILSLILFILTVLIVANYVMDWVRVKQNRYEEATA